GLPSGGSGTISIDCEDEADLRRKLVELTYPPAFESSARLAEAGWSLRQWRFATGEPHTVTIVRGSDTLTFTGSTESEAWYRAAEKLVGPPPGMKEKPIMAARQVLPEMIRGSLRPMMDVLRSKGRYSASEAWAVLADACDMMGAVADSLRAAGKRLLAV